MQSSDGVGGRNHLELDFLLPSFPSIPDALPLFLSFFTLLPSSNKVLPSPRIETSRLVPSEPSRRSERGTSRSYSLGPTFSSSSLPKPSSTVSRSRSFGQKRGRRLYLSSEFILELILEGEKEQEERIARGKEGGRRDVLTFRCELDDFGFPSSFPSTFASTSYLSFILSLKLTLSFPLSSSSLPSPQDLRPQTRGTKHRRPLLPLSDPSTRAPRRKEPLGVDPRRDARPKRGRHDGTETLHLGTIRDRDVAADGP